MIYLSVMIGGGLGSLLRFLISSFGFLPFATVFINIVGSFILGFLTFFFLDRPEVPPDLRFGLTAGFCGGFTTFSTFSVEVYAMVLDNHIGQAAFYVLASCLKFIPISLKIILVIFYVSILARNTLFE